MILLLLLCVLVQSCSKAKTEKKVEESEESPETIIIDDKKKVRPIENKGLFTNPGIGFESFNRVHESHRGNQYYPETTVAYFRPYWSDIEPVNGKIRFDVIDGCIQEAKVAGKQVAFRIISADVDGKIYIPTWLKDKGAKVFKFKRKGKTQYLPYFDDAVYMKYAQRLIAALGKRYDGHPAIASVDVSLLGTWGEMHYYPADEHGYKMPTWEIRKKYMDWHLQAFKKTPLVVLIADREALSYVANKPNIGWRGDSFDDKKYHQNAYKIQMNRTGISEQWKVGPVLFETMGVFEDEYRKDSSEENIQSILKYALDHHVSRINAKSSHIPKKWAPYIEKCLKQLGYRYVLREFTHCKQAILGDTKNLEFNAIWENIGVAPIYEDYQLNYRLNNGEKKFLLGTSQAKLREWLPGKQAIEDSYRIPADLQEGEYWLELAILPQWNLEDGKPLNLAIEGKKQDGWYKISSLQMVSQ